MLFQETFAQEFTKEIDQYKSALRVDANNIEARLQLARYFSWSGRLEEALVQYQEVLKRSPGHVEAQIGIATVYSWQKKYIEATRMLKKIVKKYPDNVDALLGLGRVYSYQAKYKESIVYFEKVLSFDPTNREALIGLGRVQSWDKGYAASEANLKKILKENPQDLEALKALANTYKWGEKYTKGIDTELQILRIEPKNVDAMLSIAYMYGQIGALAQSVHWYEKAAKIAPERGDIHAMLGLLYSHTAQVDAAANEFKKAIRLQETDIQSYIALGRVYSWQNKMEDAEKLYKKALEINPQSAGAYSGLGQLYFFNGQWAKSIEHYKRALQIDPTYVEAQQGLKRVGLLQAPTYITRYNLFINNYANAFTNDATLKQYEHDFSHELTYKFAPNKAIELRVQQNQFSEKDMETGYRNFLYEQQIMSARLDYPLYQNSLTRLLLTSRYELNRFSNVKTHEFNFPSDEWFQSGFGLLRFDHERFFTILSYAREPLVSTFTGGSLETDVLDTYGNALSYDFTDNLSWIGNFFFLNYPQGTRDRRDYRNILNYRIPFWQQMELGYEFRYQDKPSVTTNSFTARHTDRYLWDKVLLEGLYRLDNANDSENFGMTHKHIFEVFGSFDLTDWISLNLDATFQVNTGADPENFKAFRSYLVFTLDKDAILGRYAKSP